jgi:methylthioribose-1-phosphate isomerase
VETIDRAIAQHTVSVLPREGAVLTCGDGSNVDALVAARREGKVLDVFVCETRPSLAGSSAVARLAAAGVPATLIADSAAAATVRTQAIAAVIVDAARITANGDVRCIGGSYGLALAAAHHSVPFYVAAPRSVIDFTSTCDGGAVLEGLDVTPGHLITGIVTEFGLVRPPYHESVPDLATRPSFASTVHQG